MNAPPFDVAKAHRWFAIELNNRAWELAERKNRTADETAEMLHSAHASAYHWSQVGTPINAVRAMNLLATVYAYAKRYELAWQYAQDCIELLGRTCDDSTPFDHAAAAGARAWLAGLTGRTQEMAALKQEVEAKWGELPPEDRIVLEVLYPIG